MLLAGSAGRARERRATAPGKGCPMKAERMRILVGAGVAAGAATLSYPLIFRRRCLTWGARPEEGTRELPGDELLRGPDIVSTRAITVSAPPGAVWPWLVQMGSGRGGAYTYDWIENIFGLGMHSADEILPQFQDVKVGDELPLGNGPKMRVEVFDPERVLTIRVEDGNWVWIFALFPEDGTTRPGSRVMERRMLRGIKERAERLARERADVGAASS